jgi:hypothetical protein
MKRFLASAVMVFFSAAHAALACPACKDSFTKNSANAGVGELYSWSVLFMLAVPLTLVVGFGVVIAKRLRNASQVVE